MLGSVSCLLTLEFNIFMKASRPVMAFGRTRTGIRPITDRHLSVPRSGQFLNMVRPGQVGPTSVKYPRNPGQIQESLKTDRVFITSNMDVTGRVLNFKCNG